MEPRLRTELTDLSEIEITVEELTEKMFPDDPVNSPKHYTQIPGTEVIEVTEHFNFCMGNALKYILRADHKGKPEEDLEKAIWYLRRELHRRKTMTFFHEPK